MALPTNYVDDVLDASKNTERKYNIKDANGKIVYANVSIDEITKYLQQGSVYSAELVNAQNAKINELDTSKLNKTGGTMTGTITTVGGSATTTALQPTTNGMGNIGTASNSYNASYGKYFIAQSDSKEYGRLYCHTIGTESAVGACRLILGNSTAKGTDKNAMGDIAMYGTGTNYTTIASGNPTENNTVTLPTKTGALVLEDDCVTIDKLTSSQGRNLIPYPYFRPSGYIQNGVTFTVNDDGSVTANGTATGNAPFYLTDALLYKKGTYVLSGSPSGGSLTNYYIYIQNADKSFELITKDIGNGAVFTLTTDTRLRIGCQTVKDNTYNNLTFYPQLEEGILPHAYEPTTESNVSMANMLKVDAGSTIAVSSGNYKGSSILCESSGNVKCLSIYLSVASGTTGTWVEIATLPQKYIPQNAKYTVMVLSNSISAKVRIETNGKVSVRMLDGTISTAITGDTTFVYI